MKLGTYTKYQGEEYEVFNYEDLNNVEIMNLKTEEIIYVNRKELEDIFYIDMWCIYKGEKLQVMKEKEDKLLVSGYNDRVGKMFNMKLIERGIYELWVDKNSVERVFEERYLLDI